MNKKGNTKRVASADLVELFPTHKLSNHKANKSITRHFTNSALILPYNDHVLLSWLIFMSDASSTLKYSELLLKQFAMAADMAKDIYKLDKIPYNTGIDSTKNSFINLIEKGYLIKIAEVTYTINPIICYNPLGGNYSGKKIIAEYEQCLSADNVKEALVNWCKKIRKEIGKKDEIKGN